MMVTVDIAELKQQLDRLLADVETRGEIIEVTRSGAAIAMIAPMPPMRTESVEAFERRWANRRALAEEIGRVWPRGVSAVDAIRDVRRDP